jgi:hypothetical protein
MTCEYTVHTARMSGPFQGAHNVDARYSRMITYNGSVVHNDNSTGATNQNSYTAAASRNGWANDAGSRFHHDNSTFYDQSVIHNDQSQKHAPRMLTQVQHPPIGPVGQRIAWVISLHHKVQSEITHDYNFHTRAHWLGHSIRGILG